MYIYIYIYIYIYTYIHKKKRSKESKPLQEKWQRRSKKRLSVGERGHFQMPPQKIFNLISR